MYVRFSIYFLLDICWRNVETRLTSVGALEKKIIGNTIWID